LLRFSRIAAGIVVLTLVSACGGASKRPDSGGATAARAQSAPPAVSKTSAAPRRAVHPRGSATETRTARQAHDPVTRSVRPSRAHHAAKSEDRPAPQSGPLGVNPCTLVTRTEAQAIVGGPVSKPQLGLQGPTCIYQSRRLKRTVTVALQRLSLPAVTRLTRNVVRADVAGRKAVCVNYGGLKLMVPLTSGSVLTVGAPCPMATQLAATALRRLR
jgi:hypothetical protein